MLENVEQVDDLRLLARRKRLPDEYRTIPKRDLESALNNGWDVHRKNRATVRLVRPKRRDVLLEDRVWYLLYRMGFTHLSGKGGGQLLIHMERTVNPVSQIDVVGLDDELALAIECKSATRPRKKPEFQKDIAKHALIRERFARAVNAQFRLDHKRVPVLVMFTWDILLADNDVERARDAKIVLLNEHDLDYYEQLTSHLGAEHVPRIVEKERFSPGVDHGGRLREEKQSQKGEPPCRKVTGSERRNRAGARLVWSRPLTY